MGRSYIISIILFFATFTAKGQQLPSYSQYMMNGFLLNPAIAGSDGYTSVNITAREDWVGFINSPRTHAISVQSRILKRSHIIKSRSIGKKVLKPSSEGRVGIGGYVFNDKNGLVDRSGFQMTYSYHIFINNNQLSFGLSGGAFQFKINENELQFKDPNEPLINNGTKKVVYVPDASFGIFFSSYSYNIGFSVAQLFQSVLKVGSYGNYRMIRHYYFMGRYRYDFLNGFEIEPSFLLKTTERLNFQVDINCKVYYKEDYWAGLAFRTNGAIIAMLGVRVNKYYFGYAFDYIFSSIRKHCYGSHEVVIVIKFGSSARRYRWLERY